MYAIEDMISMTKTEAKRVALVIAATQVQLFIDVGACWVFNDDDAEKVEHALGKLADELNKKGRRNSGAVITVHNAIHVAGVRTAQRKREEDESDIW